LHFPGWTDFETYDGIGFKIVLYITKIQFYLLNYVIWHTDLPNWKMDFDVEPR